MSRHPWRNLKNPRVNPEDFFMHCLCEREKKCHCERSEAIQKMFVQSLDCHDFLRSLAVTEYFATPSLRGVKRRSNPESERWLMDCHGFLNENLAMTKYRRLPRRPERAPRNDGSKFLGDFKGLAPQAVGWRKRPEHFVRGLWSQGRLSAPHYEKVCQLLKC